VSAVNESHSLFFIKCVSALSWLGRIHGITDLIL
jgi:hypothetical protein